MKLRIVVESWPLTAPFRITGYVRETSEVVVVSLDADGLTGRGEAAGVRYRRDDVANMVCMLEACREQIEAGISRAELQTILPPCGARNALDCAIWDLDAKRTGTPAWRLAGLGEPLPLVTAFTCGADSPEAMAAAAVAYSDAKLLKLKLTGDPTDKDRVMAVHSVRPDARLIVDANQGFTRDGFDRLLPILLDCGVELVEQPFPAGCDDWITKDHYPLPIAADESLQSLADLDRVGERFDVVNIKLDKCGGLTEAFEIARSAIAMGLGVMVGNMGGTSLAMAPGFLLGQLCQLVDLDGPAFLAKDRPPAVSYRDGLIDVPNALWGMPECPAPAAAHA